MANLEFNNLIDKIIYYKCDILDIGNKTGDTSYIDFIKQIDLKQNNIMKGTDCCRRKFIIFKATIIYDDKTEKNTFSTFFQRYTDNTKLWHICGHDGSLIFDTCGGTNLKQLEIIDELLHKGIVNIDETNIDYFYNHINNKNPIKIVIG